jgi:hypothetical protein
MTGEGKRGTMACDPELQDPRKASNGETTKGEGLAGKVFLRIKLVSGV